MARTYSLEELREAVDDYVGYDGNPGLVVRLVAEAMETSAQHIDENWQDRALARDWRKAAAKVEAFGSKLAGWYTSVHRR